MTMILRGCPYVLLPLLVLAACGGDATYDPGATANDGGSTGTGGVGSNGDAGSSAGGGSSGELDGLYFMALSLGLLPESPIVFATTIDQAGDSATVSLQPLSSEDRSTPVGGPVVATISTSGGFPLSLPAWVIPGEADPITGNDMTLDVVFESQPSTSRPSTECGGVSGVTISPAGIPLQGSTFTLTPITDLSDAPEPPPIDCQGTLAEPL